MRTPEVEKAISNTKAGMYCTDDAEARVKELGRDSVNMFDEAKRAQNAEKDALARVAELEAQNARLRAALEDVSLLAHCISKAGPLNTPDLETAWRKFDLISVKAAEALVDRKAVLNDEEASK